MQRYQAEPRWSASLDSPGAGYAGWCVLGRPHRWWAAILDTEQEDRVLVRFGAIKPTWHLHCSAGT